uniref:Uncharacterized protein n=1 Tax=Pantoea phage Survivor TaxID=3232176 RepID=A0AAU8KXC4_9CAUD
MSKQVFDLKLAEAEVAAMDKAANDFADAVEAIKATNSQDIGMVLVNVPANVEINVKSEDSDNIDGFEVDVVLLDSITGSDGEEIEFEGQDGRKFVPSFDSKEDGKYILHYFIKADEEVLLKLKASYDHNTGIVKADGHGFEKCSVRINLKPKAE